MSIAEQPPKGGILVEIEGQQRPLLLRNAEIERFEVQHGLGVFDLLGQLVGRGTSGPQARHCRDLVALALVGGGMDDRAADQTVAAMPVSANMEIRQMAHDALVTAFLPEASGVKKNMDGSAPETPSDPPAAPGTSRPESETSPGSVTSQETSDP